MGGNCVESTSVASEQEVEACGQQPGYNHSFEATVSCGISKSICAIIFHDPRLHLGWRYTGGGMQTTAILSPLLPSQW